MERPTGPTQVMHLFARTDHDVYAATTGILRSDGNGKWSPTSEPAARAYRVSAGAPGEVLALGTQGLCRSSGKDWTKTDVDVSACTAAVVRGTAITCLHEKREPYRPEKRP